MDSNPPTKPKLSAAEVRARKAVRLQAMRLQLAIYREMDARGITASSDIGMVLRMPAGEATALLNRKHLHDGDVERLRAAAVQLGLQP